MLFIVGGAFAGLDRIVEHRSPKKTFGFGAETPAKPAEPRPEDLVRFGLIPELVGRLPVIATLEPLDHATLVRILTEPRNALIKQYRKLFALDDVELEFTDDAIDAIADLALLRRTGARATRAILEEVQRNVRYEVPGKQDVAKVVVDRARVLRNVNPTLVPREHPSRGRHEKSA